jgi:Restriction endonuclease
MRAHPDAVQIELGDLVLDDVIGKERDVDVTVTIHADNGEAWALKAFEVKDEKKPLDVTVIEQLCGKLADMSSVTNRAIVSSSGFTNSAKRKAEQRGVELYTLENWTTPIDLDFPRFGLKGLPEDAMPFSQRLLYWHGAKLELVATAAGRRFSIEQTAPLFDSTGAVHPRYKTFEQYRNEILLRSTGILCTIEPATTLATLPEFHSPTHAVSPELPYAHTLEVSSDEVYFIVDDLVKLERLTIIGILRWERSKERPDFRVMRRVSDGQPFAGALIAPGKREGQMFVFVISDGPAAGVHLVQLEERHLNMIRELSLKLA